MDSCVLHLVEVLAGCQPAQQLVKESKDLVTFVKEVEEAEGQFALLYLCQSCPQITFLEIRYE